MKRLSLLAACSGLLASVATAQELLVCNSTDDTVMKFSAVDGSLLNPVFIDLTSSTGSAPVIPIQAIAAPNGEVWISDQVADVIFRFSNDGTTYLGEFASGRDNMRGINLGFGDLWVTNSGTGNGGFGDSIKRYDPTSQSLINVYPFSGDPFSVVPFGADLLVADIAGEDLVRVDPVTGNTIAIFHDSDGITGIDFPEQLAVAPSGNVLAAGFSPPSGLYEYDTNGTEIAYHDTAALGFGGCRGIYELQNGELLFTNGAGVHTFDRASGTVTTVVAGIAGRFISDATPGGSGLGTHYCTSTPNSTGSGALMSATGSASVAVNSVTLRCSSLPTNRFGYFLTSMTQGFTANPGGSQGDLCLGGAIGRYNRIAEIRNSGGSGSFSLMLDLTDTPQPNGRVAIQPGQTWNFQCWYRDANPGPSSNFSDGIEIDFN